MDTSHTHRQSFFDYLSSENLFEFLPYDQQTHQKYLHSMPIISESLTCINSISSKIMTGIFSLYGPFLMYYEVKTRFWWSSKLKMNRIKMQKCQHKLLTWRILGFYLVRNLLLWGAEMHLSYSLPRKSLRLNGFMP